MKKILKSIIYLLVAVVVVVVGGAYLLPGTAKVDRGMVINAPPDKIYAIISDLKRMKDWSPWQSLDPAATYRFEGPEAGVGQKMSWTSSNPQVGNGSQTIVEATPNERIVTDLDFGEMGKARAYMTLSPVEGGTSVVWGFESQLSGVLERWMGLMFDKWIGADYEKGLKSLKQLVETGKAGG